MFNFSANHVIVVSSWSYDKCNLHVVKDLDTHRCYKVYDYSKSCSLVHGEVYCISGKVNATDRQLYLILEHHKEDKNYKKAQSSISSGSGAATQN